MFTKLVVDEGMVFNRQDAKTPKRQGRQRVATDCADGKWDHHKGHEGAESAEKTIGAKADRLEGTTCYCNTLWILRLAV